MLASGLLAIEASGSIPGTLLVLVLGVLGFRFRKEFSVATAWMAGLWSAGKVQISDAGKRRGEWFLGACCLIIAAFALFGLVVLIVQAVTGWPAPER